MATEAQIKEIVHDQKRYFLTDTTLSVQWRKSKLKDLRKVIKRRQDDICEALHADLGMSTQEAYMTEVGPTLAELNHQIRHVAWWARSHRVDADLSNFRSMYYSVPEPYGSVLVMSPWSKPFVLAMTPLIGAVAAGNCVVLKPSSTSAATATILSEIVKEVFERKHVAYVLGDREENAALLEQQWDCIFFTGSQEAGRLVMEKASRDLTPVTLELGGKSPCVVTSRCHLKLAARRIAFGKLLAAGQSCIAPDYVLVDERVHDQFIELLIAEIKKMCGDDAFANEDYCHLVNKKHFDHVCGLLDEEKVVYGGRVKPETLQIEPTVMVGVTPDDTVMEEEIFGPVLPVLAYKTLEEAKDFIRKREKPLALYLFSDDGEVQERFMKAVSFGGGCINDTVAHTSTSNMGFGGVGASGMGSYHGVRSFNTFSHRKSILKKGTAIDVKVRYQPYTKLKLWFAKRFLG